MFQARIVAYDGGYPRKSAMTTVDIMVVRNMHPPIFSNIAYISVSIPETSVAGHFIADLDATDADSKVRKS